MTFDISEISIIGREPDGTAEQQASRPSALDPEALKKLRARKIYRKRDLVKRVVRIYLEQTPKLLEDLETAIRGADSRTQAGLAHTIKSSSMTVGAVRLAETCKQVEQISRNGVVDESMIGRLEQEYAEVEKELREVLANEV